MPRSLALIVLMAATGVHAQTMPTPDSAACPDSGDLKFVCGIKGPEDLVAVPGTPWIIAGSITPGGGLHLIHSQTKARRQLYPGEATTPRTDQRYKSCPGQPDPKRFVAHGLNIRGADEGAASLYVVNHGERESIEVFDVKTAGPTPTLTWKGCVEMPLGVAANSVASFGDGTLLATVFNGPGKTIEQVFMGEITGAVYQWRPGDARFSLLPGSELSGNNGIEVSKDEREFYVAASGTNKVVAFSRTQPVKVLREAKMPDFLPDNIHWSDDNRLIVGGTQTSDSACPKGKTPEERVKIMMTCPHGFVAAAIEPEKLKVDVLSRQRPNPAFGSASAAIVVGDDVWFGSFATDRVAYVEGEGKN